MATIAQPREITRTASLAAEARRLAPTLLLFAAIGIELLVLVTWTPDTLRVWFDPVTYGYGDFPAFYRNAESLSLNAFYSPALSVLMHPLTYLGMRTAFTIYFGLNVAALLGIAYVAQRGVQSLPAKAAVALGVLALPQTHWALRVGHFTEILALATLAGMLLCDRKPVAGGMAIAMLALKPQYLPVPLLYFAWARNWRALGTVVGGLCVLGVLGVAVMALRDPSGAGMFGYTLGYYAERLPQAASFLTMGQRDQLYPQGWQYSWYGFLLSAGIERNPLIVAELMLVSAAAMLFVWKRCSPSVAKVAVVLGMLLLTPHTSFYNWSLLSVAAALLLRSDLQPRWLIPAMISGVALAAAATQNATPWPLPYDAYRPAGTNGLYWIQPAVLACLFALAIVGRRAEAPTTVEESPAAAPVDRLRAIITERTAARPSLALFAGGAVTALMLGYFVAAFVSNSGPFAHDPNFGRSQVLGALPSDFPVPSDAELKSAGSGERLPYRVDWRTEARTSEVAGILRQKLDDGSWQIVQNAGATSDPAAIELRSARTAEGEPPLIAELIITPDGAGSRVRLEFSPLPATLIPGYDEWLQSIGLVVHNIDPGSPAAQVTPERRNTPIVND